MRRHGESKMNMADRKRREERRDMIGRGQRRVKETAREGGEKCAL